VAPESDNAAVVSSKLRVFGFGIVFRIPHFALKGILCSVVLAVGPLKGSTLEPGQQFQSLGLELGSFPFILHSELKEELPSEFVPLQATVSANCLPVAKPDSNKEGAHADDRCIPIQPAEHHAEEMSPHEALRQGIEWIICILIGAFFVCKQRFGYSTFRF
jgi:hypothetical protein